MKFLDLGATPFRWGLGVGEGFRGLGEVSFSVLVGSDYIQPTKSLDPSVYASGPGTSLLPYAWESRNEIFLGTELLLVE